MVPNFYQGGVFSVGMPVCVAVLLLLAVGGAVSLESSHFILHEMCDVEESVNRGCSKVVHATRNLMECTRMCWSDTECLGASLGAQGRCLHHQLCHTSVPCPGPDTGRHRYMARYCVHGTWDSSTQSCVCLYGTFGERCNKYHTFCDTLNESGYSEGLHRVILDPLKDGRHLIKVLCRVKNWQNNQVFLFENSDGINLNRTWQEYVDGFWIDEENFWQGLEDWHVLGKAGITSVDITIHKTGGGWFNTKFEGCLVSNRESNYSLAGSCQYPKERSLGDCLSSLKGAQFSTWDRDQDGSVGENCASLAGSGWWYKGGNCDIPCNPMGWGLNNYQATPLRQRLTFANLDIRAIAHLISAVRIRLGKNNLG